MKVRGVEILKLGVTTVVVVKKIKKKGGKR